jgi:radical SAM-linked protein
MIVRAKYSKGEEVKYVGHLDSMRTFIRCIKRTCLPIKYSAGFNPRVQISFALPLGVGVTSESEYFDLELESKMNETLLMGELNSVLPVGFKIREVKFIEDKKSLMSLVKEAVYEISVEGAFEFSNVEELFSQSEVMLEKESKNKKEMKEFNLKDYILHINFDEAKSKIIVHSTAGSVNNMNPQFVIKAIEKYIGQVEDYEIHRKELILE